MARVFEWDHIGQANRVYARQGANAFFQQAIEVFAAGFVITNLAWIEHDVDDITRVEPQIHMFGMLQTSNKKTGHHEQGERSRKLRDYHGATGTISAWTSGIRRPFVQGVSWAHQINAKDWPDRDEDSSE